MSKKWTQSIAIPFDFYGGGAVVYNNEIHVLGGMGQRRFHYSFDGESWTKHSNLSYEFYFANAVVYNNKIHLLGSYATGKEKYHYSWDGTSWARESTLPYNFSSGNAVVYDNKIHIMGGKNNETAHYSWNGTSWSTETSLPYSFLGGQQNAVVYNNKIHILGGSQTSTSHYSLDNGSWTEESTLPYQFYYGSTIVFNDKIHILGGEQNVNKHYSWDGNSWFEEPSTPVECYDELTVQYEDSIHTLGGYNSNYRTEHYYYSITTDYNKVIFGDKTIIDLTSDTVAPEYLLQGYTAHDKTGAIIDGSYTPGASNKIIVGTETGSSGKIIDVVCDFVPGIIAIWNETKKNDNDYSNSAARIPGFCGGQKYFWSMDETSDGSVVQTVANVSNNDPSIGYNPSTNTVEFACPKYSPWYVGTYKYMIIEE